MSRGIPLLATLCITFCACAGLRSTERQPAPEPMRAAAVVTFRAAAGLDIFAVPHLAPASWVHASWLPVPATASAGLTAYTLERVAAAPVLFLAWRKPDTPVFTISTIGVNSGPGGTGAEPRAVAEPGPIPEWCAEQSWLGGFF